MLTKMTECGADYDTVLKEAQAKGYAEANPSADVDGLDAARKAAILSSLAFNTRVQLEDVSVEGITKITPDDIEYAKDLGYVIKLLAVGKDSDENGVDVRVHPVFLPKTHPLASVNGVYNAIFVRGNAIGEAMFYGQGADGLRCHLRHHRRRARHPQPHLRPCSLHVLRAEETLPARGDFFFLLCAPARRR